MHELVIANKIIEEAKKQVNKESEVKAITIEVGDLAHLPAEDLQRILPDLVDWKINIIRKTAQVRCQCHYLGEPKILERGHDLTIFECPRCARIPEVLEGGEIILKQVEVE